jgi:DNA-binding CsgD family transcriptional regulator
VGDEDASDRDDLPQRTFVAVLQQVGVPAWILDEDAHFLWANRAYGDLYGDHQGEHIGTSFAPASADEAERRLRLLGSRKTRVGSTADIEVEMLATDGRRILTQISAVRLQPGRFRGAIFGVTVAKPVVDFHGPTYLTPRQLEVLQLLAGGASTARIAADLHISRETVRNHVRDLLRAFHAHSRLEVVAKALAEGLVAK